MLNLLILTNNTGDKNSLLILWNGIHSIDIVEIWICKARVDRHQWKKILYHLKMNNSTAVCFVLSIDCIQGWWTASCHNVMVLLLFVTTVYILETWQSLQLYLYYLQCVWLVVTFCLKQLYGWFIHYIRLTRNRRNWSLTHPPPVWIGFPSEAIQLSTNPNHLELTLDNNLTFDNHITDIYKSSQQRLHAICSLGALSIAPTFC